MKKLFAGLFAGLSVLAICLLSGCANSGSSVGSTKFICCPEGLGTYRSFAVSIRNAPEFLKPYVIDAVEKVMSEKGLVPEQKGYDLLTTLTYQQTNLRNDLVKSGFDEHLSPGGDFRFNAAILIEVQNITTSNLLWSGSINRNHDVVVGESMNESNARAAIYAAISEVMKDFPDAGH